MVWKDEEGDVWAALFEPLPEGWEENPAAATDVYRFRVERHDETAVMREWFDLLGIADSCDYDVDELISDLCSSCPIERAGAYRDIAWYHGPMNLDSHPTPMTAADLAQYIPGMEEN
jgi:hypothetical protein